MESVFTDPASDAKLATTALWDHDQNPEQQNDLGDGGHEDRRPSDRPGQDKSASPEGHLDV